jgi:membrane protein
VKYFRILKNAAKGWSEDKVSVWAASLAYFTVFSLSPLLLLLITFLGIFLGEKAIEGQLFDQIKGFVGQDAAAMIEKGVAQTTKPGGNIISVIIGTITLILGATGIFGQMQEALNSIWRVKTKPKAGIKVMVIDKLLSFSMILIIGFLLAISLSLSTAINLATNYFNSLFSIPIFTLEIINLFISFVVLGVLFAAMFKILPDINISFRVVLPGAFLTSILFVIGKFLIGLYIGRSAYTSTYGAAGSLMIILVWVYYSVQILLFGVEFTRAYAREIEYKLVPSHNAVSTEVKVKVKVIEKPVEKKKSQILAYVLLGISTAITHWVSKRISRKRK